MKDTSAQSTVEFTLAMIAVMVLVLGMVQIFRWAGLDLASRQVAQDKALTQMASSSLGHGSWSGEKQAIAELSDNSADVILPMAAVYRGNITNESAGQ